MSHYSSAPRRSYVVVHHTGVGNAHQDYSTNYCQSGYDFQIRYNGQIVVCSSWKWASGNHAWGCQCRLGIMLNGCFGGCSSGNLSAPSSAQECSLAYLLAHLKTVDSVDRLRPHRNCGYWLCSNTTAASNTECCGRNLTAATASNYSWSSAGLNFNNRVRLKRRAWDATCSCSGTYNRCPV